MTFNISIEAISYLLLITLLIFIGILLFLQGIEKYKEARGSKYWIKTDGSVISSKIETIGSGQGASCHPKIQYSYTVLGENFQGNKITFGPESSTALPAYITTKIRYPVGKKIKVYYNKNNPSESVIERSILHTYKYFIFAFFLLAFSYVIINAVFGEKFAFIVFGFIVFLFIIKILFNLAIIDLIHLFLFFAIMILVNLFVLKLGIDNWAYLSSDWLSLLMFVGFSLFILWIWNSILIDKILDIVKPSLKARYISLRKLLKR